MRETIKIEPLAEESRSSLPSTLSLIASIVVHVLLLLPVLYIVGLGFENYQFFSWHPICMSLGAGLLISEAVYSISGEAYVTKKVSRSGRVTLHWILHSLGLGLLIIGFVIIIVNKNRKGLYHFATTHAQLGLSTFVIAFLVAGFGILAHNSRSLYPRVRHPVLLKVVHAFGGIGATILLLATVINGTYGGWWSHIGASETGRSLVFASLFVAGAMLLVKPIIGAAARTRVLTRQSKRGGGGAGGEVAVPQTDEGQVAVST